MSEDEDEITNEEVNAPAAADSQIDLQDACLIGESQYEIVDSERLGKVKLNLLASLAGVVNENGRYFKPEFYAAMLPRANAYIDAMDRYGEEPHPRFDADRKQFITSLQNKIWDQGHWFIVDGNLGASVYLDPKKPREAAVIDRAREKGHIGCSVRWHAGRPPKSGKTAEGQAVQLFDAEVGQYVFSAVLDYVPNPAFTQAGRVMVDAAELIPMTDATDMAALPQVQVTDAEEAAPAPTLTALVTTGSIKSEPVAADNSIKKPNFAKPTQEKRPLKTAAELRAQAQTIEDPEVKQSLLDAADAMDAAPTVDAILDRVRTELAPDIKKANAYVDAQTQRDAASAETAKVTMLADAVEAGTAPEVARFTQAEVRQKFAKKVRGKTTEAEARVVLLDAIDTQDEIQSSLDLAMKGLKLGGVADSQQAGSGADNGQARGNASGAGTERVDVIVDDKDKRTDGFLDAINAATEKKFREYGINPDSRLAASTKAKVDEICGPMEKKVGRQAIVDAVDYMTNPIGQKNQQSGVNALNAMVDAGLIESAPITDAVLTTANILQQPVFIPLVMRPLYQNLQSLKYLGAFGPNAQFRQGVMPGFDGGGGGSNMGRIFKFQSRYRERAIHNTGGRTRNSGRIGENQGIPRTTLQNSFQQFNTYRRASAFGMTKEVQNWTATGAAPFDLLGEAIAGNLQINALETDNLGYFEMVSSTLEQNSITLTAPEPIAPGNLTNGPTQDGVTYGSGSGSNALDRSPDNPYPPQGVVCIAQPDCGNTLAGMPPAGPTAAATGRLTGAGNPGFTPSASNACRTPLVIPRDIVGVDQFNNETTATRFPITVMKGNTVLVPGYLTEDFEIGSLYNPATGAPAQAQYAVDYMRGKVVFSAAAGITAATTTLTMQYTYATNFFLTQVNFGAAGYPGGVTSRAYYDTVFITNNIIAAKMGSHPNFLCPDFCLSSKIAASYIVQSDIFDKLKSPTGTDLVNPTDQTYAEYAGVLYDQVNAPSILGNDALLLFKNEFSKYVVETPLHTEGGFVNYDGSATNQLVARTEYMMNQFETFCTPLAQDGSGNVFNKPSTLNILF